MGQNPLQEIRVFANFCMDEALLDMFDKGYTDMHSYTAWYVFPHIREVYPILDKETLKGIKKTFPHERFIAKTANFAIQYGGNGSTIAQNCNIPLKDGISFYNKYFETFKGVKDYFEKVYKAACYKGFIRFNNTTGDFYYTDSLRDDEIKRNSQNYPIQGTSASITKYAMYLYYKHLLDEGLLFKVLIPNIVHDEALVEAPKEIAESEALILKKCMEDAGLKFVQRIKLTATPIISDRWVH